MTKDSPFTPKCEDSQSPFPSEQVDHQGASRVDGADMPGAGGAAQYLEAAGRALERVHSQLPRIARAAAVLTKTIVDRKNIWAFGCTHAAMLTAELFYRAGGLMVVNPLFAPGLWLDQVPVSLTSRLENLEGYGEAFFAECGAEEGDAIIVFSTSGRNAVPVGVALSAKAKGLFVIAVTSVDYSGSVSSRHSSGKRLYEVADLVLDNGAPAGDAAVALPGLPQSVGPVSTVGGAAIINAVVVQVAADLLERGIIPPVFMSANVDEGREFNRKMTAEYSQQMKYLNM